MLRHKLRACAQAGEQKVSVSMLRHKLRACAQAGEQKVSVTAGITNHCSETTSAHTHTHRVSWQLHVTVLHMQSHCADRHTHTHSQHHNTTPSRCSGSTWHNHAHNHTTWPINTPPLIQQRTQGDQQQPLTTRTQLQNLLKGETARHSSISTRCLGQSKQVNTLMCMHACTHAGLPAMKLGSTVQYGKLSLLTPHEMLATNG